MEGLDHVHTVQSVHDICTHIEISEVYKGEDLVMDPEVNTVSIANFHVHPLQILVGEVYCILYRYPWDNSKVPYDWWQGAADDKLSIICCRHDICILFIYRNKGVFVVPYG